MKGVDTMKKSNFEFETDELSNFVIEHKLCSKLGLVSPSSSNFSRLNENAEKELRISAANGSVTCWAQVTKGTTREYTVSVYCIDVTKHKDF